MDVKTLPIAKLAGERIEYASGSDKEGKCSFTLFWMADYHPGHPKGEHGWAERGQCFHADPRTYGHPRPEDATEADRKVNASQKELNRTDRKTMNEPKPRKTKTEKCPKCGQEFDPKEDRIVECPRCNVEGSTACCNVGGRNCICVKCEEGGDEE